MCACIHARVGVVHVLVQPWWSSVAGVMLVGCMIIVIHSEPL